MRVIHDRAEDKRAVIPSGIRMRDRTPLPRGNLRRRILVVAVRNPILRIRIRRSRARGVVRQIVRRDTVIERVRRRYKRLRRTAICIDRMDDVVRRGPDIDDPVGRVIAPDRVRRIARVKPRHVVANAITRRRTIGLRNPIPPSLDSDRVRTTAHRNRIDLRRTGNRVSRIPQRRSGKHQRSGGRREGNQHSEQTHQPFDFHVFVAS